ncbi:5532_t:CDS:10 [Paraglomus brasilianum]|uniref:U3 small nucleolar RNA-associated protein 25 n=1 Tax=Paraglomus brasilianum TaxID=144538 RepID=A0A9N9A7V5_9GLOM|nr:5532_t:CDS:10 [Paraglomus brasilianum]
MSDRDNYEHHFGVHASYQKVSLVDQKKWDSVKFKDNYLGLVSKFNVSDSDERIEPLEFDYESIDTYKIKKKLRESWSECNKRKLDEKAFSELQGRFFYYLNEYQDILFTNRTIHNSLELRRAYLLHIVNHILKTRSVVLKNNEKITKNVGKDVEYRDQGFTRPKALILLPFRNSALEIVEILTSLLKDQQQENHKRFSREFGADSEEEIESTKPADYVATFKGNIDDMFRFGIKFTRKTVKFYAKFYTSDIIIASPLGLRTVIGGEEDRKRDFDFLSSIEIVVLDQCNAFLMQNWDHVEHIFEHLNLIPKEAHDCDFSRVKNWYLDDRSKYLRQTIVLSDFLTPEMNSLFNKRMLNIAGKLKMRQTYEGAILDVIPDVNQIFMRIDCSSMKEADDARFKYFVEKTFPTLRQMYKAHFAVFIPSYFDYVRVRNYFQDNEYSFTSLQDYSSGSDISRARSHFFNGHRSYLLLTERFHFFRR